MLKEFLISCLSLTAVDGDTIKCDGENMRLLGQGVPFISGIDTPEINGKCEAERQSARIARDVLQNWLKEHDVKVMHSGFSDHFGRPLVNIYNENNEELGQKLLNQGYAKTWIRGKRNNWCD